MRDLVRTFGGDLSDLAAAVGMPSSALRRPCTVTTTLKLAHATGVNASELLRAFGHADIAEFLEALYGRPTSRVASDLTPHEARLIELWRGVTVGDRRHLLVLLRRLAHES